MAGEEAQAVSSRDVPHAYSAITGAGEDVQVVGVESDTVNVVIVADVDAKRLDVVR